ncbi:MAG: hypothetical protein WD009_03850 [Phycisphaeraceae bacterium]
MPGNRDFNPVERALAAMPGWLFLAAGLTLVALVLLTPAWLGQRDLAWQRDLMRLQVRQIERQAQRYADFHAALGAEEPVLLERLALTQFGLNPTDKTPLWLGTVADDRGGGVDAWLAEPLPRVGVDVPARTAIESRLTRLTSGSTRTLLIAAGRGCALGGVWATPEGQSGDR